MRGTRGGILAGGGCGQLDRLARDVRFGVRTAAGNFLDLMAITVTRGEVHTGVSTPRIGAQGVFHQAHVFNKGGPVCGT